MFYIKKCNTSRALMIHNRKWWHNILILSTTNIALNDNGRQCYIKWYESNYFIKNHSAAIISFGSSSLFLCCTLILFCFCYGAEGIENTNTSKGTGTLGRPSLRHKLCTIWNKHRNPIIISVHAQAKANSCAKYQQDPWNIVDYRAV